MRNVVGGVLVALLLSALVAWTTRARWLPYAIAAAPNAGKSAADLDEDAPLPAAVAGVSRDLRVDVGPPAASLSLRVLEPDTAKPHGTIFVLHGIRDSKRSMLVTGDAFRRAGYRVVLVDLRGQGRSTGDWLSFGDREGRDLHEVADALAADGVLALPVGVYGPSYGGAVALQMARRDPRIRAVVTVATYTRMKDIVPIYGERLLPSWLVTPADYRDAVDRAGVLGDFRPDDADSVAAITATRAQVLLIHGRDDANIPWRHAVLLHAAALDHSRLDLVDGKNHRTIMSDPSVLRASAAWFDRWLAPLP